MECVMKLNSTQVEETLNQFDARVLPDDHPLVQKLNDVFGDHTFFLDNNGLNIVEPNKSAANAEGMVINVADWSDSELTSLVPHEPVPTEVVVVLEGKH
jgi:hypothetical protein